jgi:hypothetical protein
MFSFLKSDPKKKLQKAHKLKLEQAMLAQRNGDMRSYASLTTEAEKLLLDIRALDSK